MVNKKGFTLIELLIVILIMSIVMSAAVLTMHFNQKKQIEQFAQQLINLLTLASEEALLRPATLGVHISDQAIQFFIFEKNQWRPFHQTIFKKIVLPANTYLSLAHQEESLTPMQLIITPSGDITPFVLFISKKNETPDYQIIGKANGEIQGGFYEENP